MKTKKRAWLLAAVFCLGVLAASAAQAAQSVLDVIPDDALGFALINRIGQTDAKIKELGELIQMPITQTPLEAFKRFAGIEKGLDEKGTAALVVMRASDPDDDPRPVAFVPVTDYKAFIGQFEPEKVTDAISRVTVGDGPSLVANKGDYALFVKTDNQDLLESLLASRKSVAEQVTPWREWIDRSDAVAVATGHAVKLFAEEASDKLDEVRPMFEGMGEQGAQVVAVFEMYKKILRTASKELTMAGVGVLVEKDGSLRLSGRGQFAPDGQLAGWFKGAKGRPSNTWTGIPNEPFALAAAGVLPEGLMKGLMDFSTKMMKNMQNIYGLNEEQMEKLADISVKSMKGVRGMSMALGVVEPGQPLYRGVTGTMWVDDAEAFLDRYAEVVKSMSKLAAEAEHSPLTTMTATPTQIAGRKGFELTVDLAPMYERPELEQLAPLFKAMYGPDSKLSVYLAAADRNTVVFAYLDKAGAVKAVKAATGASATLAADPTVAAMTKRLPADAQWIGFWSPRGTVQLAGRMIEGFAPEGSAVSLPEFPKTPPIGFAMKVSPTGAHKELLIPVEALKELSAYVKQIQMQGMQVRGRSRKPSRVHPPEINAGAAGRAAMKEYDTNKDGKAAGDELLKAPSLNAAIDNLDQDGDKAVSAEEVTARIEKWQESKLGRMSMIITVTFRGKPLQGASVVLEPEKFLGENVKAAKGTTDQHGMVVVRTVDSELPGVAPGLYKVKITKEGMNLPAKYNKQTTLGIEVAVDSKDVGEEGAKIDLK